MLTKIRQVNEEFFRKFYNLNMTMGGTDKTILCRYARKSSGDYSEEQDNQEYPCIALQDYSPTVKKEWYVDMVSYFGGVSSDGLKGYLYKRPIWMEFVYDVSIAAKSYNDYMAMQDYFMQNFIYGKRFLFNQKLNGDDAVGDVVPYEVRDTDITRSDGVFETNYEFTCSVWLYPQDPKEVDLIQNIVVSGLPISMKSSDGSVEQSLSEDTFKVKIAKYSEEVLSNYIRDELYGYEVITGSIVDVLKQDIRGFTVELFNGENLIDTEETQISGEVNLLLPKELGVYTLRLTKGEDYVETEFTYKELNSGTLFLWVFE